VFFNKPLLGRLGLRAAQIEAEKDRVRRELEKRNHRFRKGRSFPDLSGKRVILVDDGLASGFTMLASVHMARKIGARETIVAVPTAPQGSIERIAQAIDKIYCANIRTGRFFAVADAYRNWHDLSESEVLEILHETDQKKPQQENNERSD
jgi:predicted phosphoribosyltransferase